MPAEKRNHGKRKKTDSLSQPTAPATIHSNSNGSSPSNVETLRRLYGLLLRSRRIQERVRDSSEASRYDLKFGCEAVVVGATAELGPGDTILASDRNLGALLAKGAPVGLLLSATADAGTTAWCSAASLPHDPFHAGVGIAVAHMLTKKKDVVVAFAAPEQPAMDAWQASLQFAAGHKLPVVFVIENGAPSDPKRRNPHLEPISFMTRNCGFPGIVVDGHDVVAVWRVAQEAIRHARDGSGPTLIDCRTDGGQDPLAHLEHYLRKRNAWEDEWRQAVERDLDTAIEAAHRSKAPLMHSHFATGPTPSV